MSFNLEKYNTFGIKACASSGYVLNDLAMLPFILDKIRASNNGYIMLGCGSDVLFTDDFAGVVVVNRLQGMHFEEDLNSYYMHVEAGELLHDFIKVCMHRGIYGLEQLALIPGTVGAAPIQNVGAYGASFSDFCRYVEVYDIKTGKHERLSKEDCSFGYRDSIFKRTENKSRFIITAVGLEVAKKWQADVKYSAFKNYDVSTPQKLFDAVCAIRTEKLPNPNDIGNAGSFFKNPIVSLSKLYEIQKRFENVPSFAVEDEGLCKLAAGWLIEKAGCKGLKMGRAGTYEKQALVIVNFGGAEAKEILDVAYFIIKRVKEEFGVVLEPEVRIYGSNGECSL